MTTKKVVFYWLTISFLVLITLYYTWVSAFSLSQQKVNLLAELTDLQRLSIVDKTNYHVAIIGTSLARTGFSNEETLNQAFNNSKKKFNKPIHFTKLTIGSANAKELEPAIIKAIENKVDLILVEINPWTLSFHFSQKITHHRLWVSALFQSYLGVTPQRFIQVSTKNNAIKYVNATSKALKKFNAFEPKLMSLSPLTMQAINKNSHSTIKFFYPGWSKDVELSKSKNWKDRLQKTHKKITRQTGIGLLPAIPNLPSDHYSDLVHPNKEGSREYMKWLSTVITEYANNG